MEILALAKSSIIFSFSSSELFNIIISHPNLSHANLIYSKPNLVNLSLCSTINLVALACVIIDNNFCLLSFKPLPTSVIFSCIVQPLAIQKSCNLLDCFNKLIKINMFLTNKFKIEESNLK